MGLENVKEWVYQAIAATAGPTEENFASIHATIPTGFELSADGSFELKDPNWSEVVMSLQSEVRKLHAPSIIQDIGHIEDPFWGDFDDTTIDILGNLTHSDQQFQQHQLSNLPGMTPLSPQDAGQGSQLLTQNETPTKRKRSLSKKDSTDVPAKKKQRASPAREGVKRPSPKSQKTGDTGKSTEGSPLTSGAQSFSCPETFGSPGIGLGLQFGSSPFSSPGQSFTPYETFMSPVLQGLEHLQGTNFGVSSPLSNQRLFGYRDPYGLRSPWSNASPGMINWEGISPIDPGRQQVEALLAGMFPPFSPFLNFPINSNQWKNWALEIWSI
jgi:hypothetical protein